MPKAQKGFETVKISEFEKKFRILIGAVLVGGSALGLNQIFFLVIGALLLVSGFMGQCAIAKFLDTKK